MRSVCSTYKVGDDIQKTQERGTRRSLRGMQTGFRELQRFRGLSREIARLVSMEGFRQRKSARIELQISKINGYSTKHLARGLGAATEERTVAKSQESDQKKGKGQDLTDNLTTSGTVVELDERCI